MDVGVPGRGRTRRPGLGSSKSGHSGRLSLRPGTRGRREGDRSRFCDAGVERHKVVALRESVAFRFNLALSGQSDCSPPAARKAAGC